MRMVGSKQFSAIHIQTFSSLTSFAPLSLYLDSRRLTSLYEPIFKSHALALFSDTLMTPSVYVWLCMGFLDRCD